MNRFLSKIVVLGIAAMVAMTSGGVNIYHYCCEACAEYGRNIFLTVSCEEVHTHHHCDEMDCQHCGNRHSHDGESNVSEDRHDLCSHLASKTKHCDVHHFNAPQLQKSNHIDFKITLPVAAVMFENRAAADIFAEKQTKEYRFMADPPLFIDGRAVIVLKNSYLI